eukprot:1370490-Heterocapsa_arctica.AAC.1
MAGAGTRMGWCWGRLAIQRTDLQRLLRLGPVLPSADGTCARGDPRPGDDHHAAAGKGPDG